MRMGSQARADERGFTLAELLVAIAILGLIMGGILTLLMTGNQSYLTGSNQAEAQGAVRAALERMTTDLREGGYDPQGRGCTAVGTPAGCFDAIVNPANVAQVPGNTSFMIQSDWNGSPVAPAIPIEPLIQVGVNYCFGGPCPPAVWTPVNRGERITYSIVGGSLTRQESFVDAQPQTLMTGVQQAGVGRNCAGAQIANPPFFQYCYYDPATGNALAAASPWQIKEIIVNMRVGVQNQPPAIWQAGAVQVTMSDRIRLRNRP